MRRSRLLAPLAAGLLVASTPTVANAYISSQYTYGCSNSSVSSALHASLTRIRYSGGGSAIYGSATASWKQVKSGQPDVTWKFDRFYSSGLQTRYSQPTQWGSEGNPLSNVSRYVDTYWKGYSSLGGAGSAMCRTSVLP